MQLRLKPRTSRNLISRGLILKSVLIFLAFFLGIFILDKIDLPFPKELIKKEISNDKLITLK